MRVNKFSDRHIGPRVSDIEKMLKLVNVDSLEQLMSETIPSQIHLESEMNLPEGLTESRFIEHMKQIAQKNKKQNEGQAKNKPHEEHYNIQNIVTMR